MPPEIDETSAAEVPSVHRRPPRRDQRLDWAAVAREIALGKPADAVAREFGCRADRIWRNMKRSRRFRARIELELDRVKLQTSIQFRNLAGHAVDQLGRQTEKLDGKTLLWLAERLRIGGRPMKADALAHWLTSVAALQIGEAPLPRPEPEGPVVVGSKEEFREELKLAEEIGSERLIQGVIRVEKSRIDVNYALRNAYEAERQAAEARIDV